jgi:hypothetical protein
MVVVDNLGSHRRPDIQAAIRGAGAKLFFLSKYSPDLNPIEQVFASSNTCFAPKPSASSSAPAPPRERARYFNNAAYAPA